METENQNPFQTAEPPKKSRRRKVILISFLLLVVVAGGGFSVWYLNQAPKTIQQKVTKPKPKPVVKPEPAKDPALVRFITPTTGETWLPQPKKLSEQSYFVDYQGQPTPGSFYEVGKRQTNTIILGVFEYGIGTTSVLFEKNPAGSISAILQPDTEATYNQDDIESFAKVIKADITKDITTRYDSLSMPRKIDLDKGEILSKTSYPTIGDFIQADNPPNGTVSEVRKIGQSILKKTEFSYVDTKLTSLSYYLQTPINTKLALNYEPLEPNLGHYQWSVGRSGSSDQLRPIARGCGGLGSSVTRSDTILDTDVQVVGKSPSGHTVYQLKDPNHPLVQKAYDEFKEYAGGDNTTLYSDITKEDFIKEHALVLYKDKFNQWLVYAREQLSPAYGCAKPVVYLYPTKTQPVTVRVGAKVKVSDPFYNPKTGWRVIAQPNGQLTHNKKQYGSLFWEGPGIGEYPSVTSGTIVKRSQAVATIRQQLSVQGLNQTEINDFVNYWEGKLPDKPYIRLTWFDTAQMEQLAPLSISPHPDTVIRVFLDFSGLDQPINLPPQELKTTPRSGFTVVEWGGLSPKKLY